MPAVAKIEDWEAAYDAYMNTRAIHGVTQRDYAFELGVHENHLSTKFNEVKRNRIMQGIKGKMPEVLAKSLERMSEGLDYMKQEDMASVSTKVFSTLADRDGMSPQAQIINIQQRNSQNIVSVPLFEEGKKLAEEMLKDEADAYPEVIDAES